jgi:protein O-GlcNAc transferase
LEIHQIGGVDSLIDQARAALGGGAAERALELADAAALKEPSYPDVHNLRGLCLMALEQPDDALEAFDQAIGLNDEYADAHENRARVLGSLGRRREAQHAELCALRIAERRGGGRYAPPVAARLANEHARLGDIYAECGLLREAAEQYRQACEIQPHYIDIRNRLARVLIELGILEAAVRELRNVLEVNDAYAEAYANLGHALYRMGDTAGAVAAWRHCLGLNPDHPSVRASLRMLEDEDGDEVSTVAGRADGRRWKRHEAAEA